MASFVEKSLLRITCYIFGLSLFVCGLEGGSMCEDITLPMCSGIPYNKTRMPNLLDHSTQENARLAIEQFQDLVDTNCSDVLVFFLCAMYAPICTYNFGPFGSETVPPCKSICQRAKDGCEPIMKRYDVSWPSYLSCKDLPVYDQGVCISPDAIVDTMPDEEMVVETPSPADESSQTDDDMSSESAFTELPPIWQTKEMGNCDECPYEYSINRDVFFEKEYEYIIRARVQSYMQYTAREMFTTVIVQDVIKFSGLIIPEGEVQLWSRGTCACPNLDVGQEYFILCYEDLQEGRLLLETDCTVDQFHEKYIKRLRKWNSLLLKEQRMRRHYGRQRGNQMRRNSRNGGKR